MIIITYILFSIISVFAQDQYPPKINQNDFLKPVEYKEYDATFVLGCSADANPPAEYFWRHEGRDIPDNSASFQMDRITGELKIKAMSSKEEGKYQCLATNNIGGPVTTMSKFKEIRIPRLGRFNSTGPVPAIPVEEGRSINLPCRSAPESVPNGAYKWYRGDEGAGEVVPNERIAINSEGTLYFVYALKSDQLDKPYQCAVFNEELKTIVLGSPTQLNVASVPNPPSVQPELVFSSRQVLAYYNRTVELECVFSGKPVPIISWTNNLQLPVYENDRYKFSDHGRVLRILKVQESDRGRYTCTGSNDMGTNTAPEIDLTVTSEPLWVDILQGQVVPASRDAIFTCITRAMKGDDEIPPPVWFENGNSLPQDKFAEGKYEFAENQKVLIVRNVEKTDITCFQCQVTNKRGSVFADGCLNVVDPIVITVRPKPVQEIIKGDMVNLTVQAITDPSLTIQYRWFIDGQPVKTFPDYIYFDEDTNVAFINTEGMEDDVYRSINGTYICEVFHSHERVNVTMEVLLKEVGIAGPIRTGGSSLWWIALLVAIIFLICVIAIIVVVCKRKAQEGVYPLDRKERDNHLDPEKDLADSGFSDLSRADYDGPEKKGTPLNFTDEPLNFDADDDSLAEYSEGDMGKFNEDGSFIGVYLDKKPQQPIHKAGSETAI